MTKAHGPTRFESHARPWACAGVLTASLAFAALGASSPPAQPDDPADAAALRGPAVTPRASRSKTLVERDFDQRLKRLEEPPVYAAARLLELGPEERIAVNRVLDERRAMFDALVKDHLREVAALAQARQAGDAEGTRTALRELMTAARPILAKGPLVDQVKSVIAKEHGAELDRLVREYAQASIADRRSAPDTDAPMMRDDAGEHLRDGEATIRERSVESFTQLGMEIRSSYQRVVQTPARDFDALIKELALTPEQESAARQKVGDLFQKTYGKPTRLQQARVFLDIYHVLDASQRQRLMEIIRERRSEEHGGSGVPRREKRDVPTLKPSIEPTKSEAPSASGS